jgi:transcriptional regulator with XRE-family HTH domain
MSKSDFVKMVLAMRKERKMSQGLFAKALGYSAQYVCDLEHGRRAPTTKFVNRICIHFSLEQFEWLQWHSAGARANGWQVPLP